MLPSQKMISMSMWSRFWWRWRRLKLRWKRLKMTVTIWLGNSKINTSKARARNHHKHNKILMVLSVTFWISTLISSCYGKMKWIANLACTIRTLEEQALLLHITKLCKTPTVIRRFLCRLLRLLRWSYWDICWRFKFVELHIECFLINHSVIYEWVDLLICVEPFEEWGPSLCKLFDVFVQFHHKLPLSQVISNEGDQIQSMIIGVRYHSIFTFIKSSPQLHLQSIKQHFRLLSSSNCSHCKGQQRKSVNHTICKTGVVLCPVIFIEVFQGKNQLLNPMVSGNIFRDSIICVALQMAEILILTLSVRIVLLNLLAILLPVRVSCWILLNFDFVIN